MEQTGLRYRDLTYHFEIAFDIFLFQKAYNFPLNLDTPSPTHTAYSDWLCENIFSE